MSASRSDWRSIAAFVLLILIWAYNWIVMKVALQEAGPVTVFVFAHRGRVGEFVWGDVGA